VIRDLPQRVYHTQPGIPRRAAVAGRCIVPGSLVSWTALRLGHGG
jgi:hypothetical protein